MPDKVKAASPFVVMVKPVGSLCNQQCGYCYYLGTDELLSRAAADRMSDATLESLIRGYIETSTGPVVQFTWHGGEPTLAGLDFYRRAVELERKYLPEGRQCWNNLQTNGLLLDDEWCEFIARERFDVGLSVDGDESNHDLMRRDRGGNGTWERAAEAVRRLQRHGVQPDILCTVTSYAAKRPLEIYRALSALDTGWTQFIPIVRREDGKFTPDSVSGADYGYFLREVFDEWIRRDVGRLEVQLFAETARVWAGGSPGLCWMGRTCGRALIVERDGDVYSCDHFVDSAHRLGALPDSLGALADGEAQTRFGRAKFDALPKKCRECRYISMCGGGCPKDRFATDENDDAPLNVLCGGLHEFFSHSERQLKLLGELRRRGLSPDAVSAAIAADRAEMWKGVGRNDPCPCGSGLKAKRCCWDKRL